MSKAKNIYYIHFDTVSSTNTWAKENAHLLDLSQITCITAQEQRAGRGRSLRKWLSPKGQNIYATLYFCLPRHFSWISNLGQILSLSCSTVLKQKGFAPQIKWPNDLLLDGKKVAGVLCETVSFPDRIGVVLGIGINVNMSEDLLNTIDQPATSLAQLTGRPWQLEQILEPLLQQFLEDLGVLQIKGFASFHAPYEQLLAYKGKAISFHNGEKKVSGVCQGINAEGHLQLLLSSGKIATYPAGEIKF